MRLLGLLMILLVANLLTTASVDLSGSGCANGVAELDYCPHPAAEPARHNNADRNVSACVTCVEPEPNVVPSFEPRQNPLTFVEAALLVTTRADGPLHPPPRQVS